MPLRTHMEMFSADAADARHRDMRPVAARKRFIMFLLPWGNSRAPLFLN
jgi:hypothetical protein